MKPPYYAVIFTSIRTEVEQGYNEMADLMIELAKQQEGFIALESARTDIGITVSYWKNLESIKKWKENVDHLQAQKRGKSVWYSSYKVRIALVEREYDFVK